MATKNAYFNPYIEAPKAFAQNLGNFLTHPGVQSQLAAQAAQQMFKDYADAARPMSGLNPYMRPGVAQDSPDALTPEQMKLLQQRGLLGQ